MTETMLLFSCLSLFLRAIINRWLVAGDPPHSERQSLSTFAPEGGNCFEKEGK